MKDKEKQQCVICHKDISSELPKIDIYGNHYCKDCYIEKCKYEFMNMKDTILINKKLLKRELQYLEEQTQKYTRKETAREIFEKIKRKNQYEFFSYNDESYCVSSEHLNEIAKQYGVEIKE